MKERYDRNIGMLSVEEMSRIRQTKVCVVGCGGLGGYLIEYLARLGIGSLTVVDGDVFEESNLNRQLLATEKNIGQSKAKAAEERIRSVNSDVDVKVVTVRIDEKNGEELIAGHDIVVDGVDNITTRLLIQSLSEKAEIPFVHGAIAGWYGQVTTILPGDRTLELFYKKSGQEKGVEQQLGNPSFTPALIASLQIAEVVKLIIGRGELLRKTLLYYDAFYQETQKISL